ncbi:AI-2E family transporter [Treponema brennaborense]|nr:AI-2E family transporter [Treponema brennaborense]
MDNKRTLQTVFMFALFALLFVLILGMLHPFFTVILWTILLYIILNPLHHRCVSRLNAQKKLYEFRRHVLAGVFSVGTLIIIIGPLITIATLLVQQMLSFLHAVEDFINRNPDFLTSSEIGKSVLGFIDRFNLDFIDLNSTDLRTNLIKFIQQYSSRIVSTGATVLSSTGNFLVSVLFVTFALYFCFLDGRYLASLLAQAIPINPQYMSALMKKFAEITRHLFSGYILVALYQGFAAFIIMSIFRVQGSLLFAVILMFASFIPLFGAALVWLPMGIVICATDSLLKGILFLVLCGICVSFLDNFLRPMFLKDRIKVHPLVIFFAILGGLKVFGMNGLLLGPMIIILFFTVLDLLVNSEAAVPTEITDSAE